MIFYELQQLKYGKKISGTSLVKKSQILLIVLWVVSKL